MPAFVTVAADLTPVLFADGGLWVNLLNGALVGLIIALVLLKGGDAPEPPS